MKPRITGTKLNARPDTAIDESEAEEAESDTTEKAGSAPLPGMPSAPDALPAAEKSALPDVAQHAPDGTAYQELNLQYDEQGFPVLSLAQLYAWNVASLEAENAKLKADNAKLTRQLWLEQQSAYRKLSDDISRALVEKEARDKKHKAAIGQISQELGFNFEGCIVDDRSGRITFVDSGNRPIMGGQRPPDHARLTRAD